VIELLWFVAGAAIGCAAVHAVATARRRRVRTGSTVPTRTPAVRPASPSATPSGAAGAPGPASVTAHPGAPIDEGGRRVALSLAEELATLVSGVEGRAHHLIAKAPDRTLLPLAAEGLLLAVQRLRTLHNKLVAFGGPAPSTLGTTDVPLLIASLADELQAMQFGLELRWTPPLLLPPIASAPEVMRDALLFLCASLLRAERGATRLSIAAELGLAGDLPLLQLEVTLEWVVESVRRVGTVVEDPTFTLDFEAANNLIVGQGGELSLTHLPGRSVRALVHLPALLPRIETMPRTEDELPPSLDAPRLPDPAQPQDVAAAGATTRHHFGGALVLETDPSVRAMLAKATGRAVFACADGAAARSFLEATPERFELLIVDHHRRLDGDHSLTETIRSHAPDLKICVLGTDRPGTGDAGARRHWIQKPFGVHELRQALATVLAEG
jgi:hypothetical protein